MTQADHKRRPGGGGWAPPLWYGMSLGGWLRLLRKNRFAVRKSRISRACTNTLACLIQSLLGGLQKAVYECRVARTALQPPLFIVGHWRTGTTWLHELLASDPRHTAPSTYECAQANHFLLTACIFSRFFESAVPQRRWMDNVLLGATRPQEEEFALCNLGLPSPYLKLAFPNHPQPHPRYYTLLDLSEAERARWQSTYLGLLRTVALRRPGRLVLKGPLHTWRLATLAGMFPRARFIHTVRHPHSVFPSMLHTWQVLGSKLGYQKPHGEGLPEEVLDTLIDMYRSFDAQRDRVGPERLVDVRYEDLRADPIGCLRGLYDRLDLGDFEAARPAIQARLDEARDYRPNRYALSSEWKARLAHDWGFYFDRYGYEREPGTAAVPQAAAPSDG